MTTVDASIPLAAGQIQWAPNPQQTMSLLEFGQAMRQRQQQQQAQNALKSVFSNPQSLGPDGQLTPEAIAHVSAIDPATGMSLRQQQVTNAMHQSTIEKNRAQMGAATTEQQLKKQDYIVKTMSEPATIAYEEAKKRGLSDQQASEVAQQEWTKGLQTARSSGLFDADSFDDPKKFPPRFDYASVSAHAQSLKDYRAAEEKKAADKRAEDAAARAEKAEAERERHDHQTEKVSGEREARAEQREQRLESSLAGAAGKPPAGYRWSKDKPGELEVVPGGPAARKEGAGLTVADKMNPVMLATVRLDVKEGRQAIDFMEKAGLDKGSAFYADEHGAGAGSRLVKKFFAPEKEQEFDVYANKLGQAIASAQSMGRGQISESKIREAQKAIPVMGDSKHIRDVKMGQLKAFFTYVDEILKTPIKPGARGVSDEAADQQDAADFSALWK